MAKTRIPKNSISALGKRIAVPKELSKPPQHLTLFASEVSKAEYEEAVQSYFLRRAFIGATATIEKMPLLFDRYGLPRDNNWFALCLSMASEFFEGFKLEERGNRGPKTIWYEGRLVLLWLTVRERTGENKKGVSQACMELSKQNPWKDWLRAKNTDPHKTLTNKYYDGAKIVEEFSSWIRSRPIPDDKKESMLQELLCIMAGINKKPPEN